jgi:hypothetical protein
MLFSDPISHLLVLQRTRVGIEGMRAKRVLGNLVATPWEAWKMQSNEEGGGGNLDREKRMSTLEAVVQTTNREKKRVLVFQHLKFLQKDPKPILLGYADRSISPKKWKTSLANLS